MSTIPKIKQTPSTIPGHPVVYGGGSKDQIGGQVQIVKDPGGTRIDANGNQATIKGNVMDSTFLNLGYGGDYGGLGVLAIGNDAILPNATVKIPQTNTALRLEQYLDGSQDAALHGDTFGYKANPRAYIKQGLGNLKLNAYSDLPLEHPDAPLTRGLKAKYKSGNGSIGAELLKRGDKPTAFMVNANYKW